MTSGAAASISSSQPFNNVVVSRHSSSLSSSRYSTTSSATSGAVHGASSSQVTISPIKSYPVCLNDLLSIDSNQHHHHQQQQSHGRNSHSQNDSVPHRTSSSINAQAPCHFLQVICPSNSCNCQFQSNQIYMCRVYPAVEFVTGVWSIMNYNHKDEHFSHSSDYMQQSHRYSHHQHQRSPLHRNKDVRPSSQEALENPLILSSCIERFNKIVVFGKLQHYWEILNHDAFPTQPWTTVEQAKNFWPRNFMLRRDTKYLLPGLNKKDPDQYNYVSSSDLIATHHSDLIIGENRVAILKEGTIMQPKTFNIRPVKKGRRGVQEKCVMGCKIKSLVDNQTNDEDNSSSTNLSLPHQANRRESSKRTQTKGSNQEDCNVYYLTDSDGLIMSPMAVGNSISGIHQTIDIIQKFMCPIKIRPVTFNQSSGTFSLYSQNSSIPYNANQSQSNQHDSFISLMLPTQANSSNLNDRNEAHFYKLFNSLFTESPYFMLPSNQSSSHLPPPQPFLELVTKHCANLFFLSPFTLPKTHPKSVFFASNTNQSLSSSGLKMFIITSQMFLDHKFELIDENSIFSVQQLSNQSSKSNPSTYAGKNTHHNLHVHLRQQTARIHQFFAKPHAFTSLEYLVKLSRDVSRESPSSSSAVTASTISPVCTIDPQKMGEICEELEEIYFYIRNGFYRERSKTRTASNVSSRKNRQSDFHPNQDDHQTVQQTTDLDLIDLKTKEFENPAEIKEPLKRESQKIRQTEIDDEDEIEEQIRLNSTTKEEPLQTKGTGTISRTTSEEDLNSDVNFKLTSEDIYVSSSFSDDHVQNDYVARKKFNADQVARRDNISSEDDFDENIDKDNENNDRFTYKKNERKKLAINSIRTMNAATPKSCKNMSCLSEALNHNVIETELDIENEANTDRDAELSVSSLANFDTNETSNKLRESRQKRPTTMTTEI